MDLNPNTLDCASRRIAPYQPEIYQQNILAPITNEIDPFDSVAINYLLHCLPGSMDEKAVVLDNLIPLLNPKAVLFGSTILKSDQKSSWLARKLMKFYNSKGIFSNTTDTQDALEAALRSRFNTVSIELAGGVALFSAANAIQTGH